MVSLSQRHTSIEPVSGRQHTPTRTRRFSHRGLWAQVLACPRSWTVLWTSSGLLGLQQGMVWSVTILLFMDLLGPRRRGLASGANETLGYAASALFSKVRPSSIALMWWSIAQRALSTTQEALSVTQGAHLGLCIAGVRQSRAACGALRLGAPPGAALRRVPGGGGVAVRARGRLASGVRGQVNPPPYSDEKVTNRDMRIWHFAIVNGY